MAQCNEIETGQLIHAYEVGLLEEDEQDRFEIHLLECVHCYDEMQRFETAAKLLRESPEVRAALQQDAVAAEPETTEPLMQRIWRYLWPDTPLVFRPALIYTAVLLAILPTSLWLNTGVDQPEMRPVVRPVQTISLYPFRSEQDQVLHLSTGGDGTVSFVYPRARQGESYRVVLTTAEKEIVYQENPFDRFGEDQSGSISLSLDQLKAGNYQLVIDNPADTRSPPQVYYFSIVD